jgi:hypothetical protein
MTRRFVFGFKEGVCCSQRRKGRLTSKHRIHDRNHTSADTTNLDVAFHPSSNLFPIHTTLRLVALGLPRPRALYITITTNTTLLQFLQLLFASPRIAVLITYRIQTRSVINEVPKYEHGSTLRLPPLCDLACNISKHPRIVTFKDQSQESVPV